MKWVYLLSLPLVIAVYSNNLPLAEPEILQVAELNVHEQWQGKHQSVSTDKGFVFDVAYLYWQAKSSGLEYGLFSNVKVHTTPTISIEAEASPLELDFSWKPGVQVSLGYLFSQREQWEALASWTTFYSKAEGNESVHVSTSGTGCALRPIWVPALTGAIADRLNASWTLHFNTLDFSLGRNFFLGRWFAVKPTVAVRVAWINQDYEVKARAIYPILASFEKLNTRFETSNDFNGGGLKVGSGLQWFICRHWSLLGDFAASLLYGEFDVKEQIKGGFGIGDAILPEKVVMNQRTHRLVANGEGKLGVQWQQFFRHEKNRLALGLYYNLSYWFSQNQLMNQIIVPGVDGNVTLNFNKADKDLYFQGGSVQFLWEF